MPQHGRQPGVGHHQEGLNQAPRHVPDAGQFLDRFDGCDEALRGDDGEPAMAPQGRRSAAAHEAQRLPGYAICARAGRDSGKMQFRSEFAAVAIRQQVRVKGEKEGEKMWQ